MSGKRITRTQAERNLDLKREIEEFNPFVPKKELSRGEDDHSFNISAFSNTSTEPLNNSSNLSQENFTDSNLIDVSVLSNNTTKTLIDLDNSYLNNTLENKMASTNEASDCITDGARGLVGKRGDTAMRELFFPFK